MKSNKTIRELTLSERHGCTYNTGPAFVAIDWRGRLVCLNQSLEPVCLAVSNDSRLREQHRGADP